MPQGHPAGAGYREGDGHFRVQSGAHGHFFVWSRETQVWFLTIVGAAVVLWLGVLGEWRLGPMADAAMIVLAVSALLWFGAARRRDR